ncbi:hypothetical protein [Ottowia sp.]|uniref:hypothetical protein n=1 Tax=Ottowia sp. TaxID=1898956 RepID=UPI002B512CD2|nr:hypothetical protein [Ottowia sp.]HRN77476.1 hypothetical protein [Ottowia sp.]HRQ04255.1 hypothetical protein [Ottowia sp.]
MASVPERPVQALVRLAREHGARLLAAQPEPHVELLTLLWGSRFDREHAQGLIEQAAATPVQRERLRRGLRDAAERFDRMSAPEQQRLRRLVLRHWRAGARPGHRMTIAPCTASC